MVKGFKRSQKRKEQVCFEDAIKELEAEPCIAIDACHGDFNVGNEEYMPALSTPNVEASLNEHASSLLTLNLATEEETLEEDTEVNRYSLSTCGTRVPPLLMFREVPVADGTIEADSFCETYVERMGWFDILSYERTCGICAMLRKEMGTAGSPLQRIESDSFTIPQFSRTKLLKQGLSRSLQDDFELFYGDQACSYGHQLLVLRGNGWVPNLKRRKLDFWEKKEVRGSSFISNQSNTCCLAPNVDRVAKHRTEVEIASLKVLSPPIGR
ncbi:uncharacterized protein J3R85_001244 [Psidium guajava]|nr:uncharacterized protein J3R85_001244 [Psidium guajava]